MELIAHVAGLERHPPGPEVHAPRSERPREVARVDLTGQIRDLVPRLLLVSAVGEEQSAVGGEDGLAVRAAEPGQIPDVGQAGDQERVRLELLESRGELGAPRRVVHGRR